MSNELLLLVLLYAMSALCMGMVFSYLLSRFSGMVGGDEWYVNREAENNAEMGFVMGLIWPVLIVAAVLAVPIVLIGLLYKKIALIGMRRAREKK